MHNMPHTEEAKEKMRKAHLGKPAPWKLRETKIGDNGSTLYKCGSCRAFLPASAFYSDKRVSIGIKSTCKPCHTRTSLATRNPERSRETNSSYQRRARAADPDKFRRRDRMRIRVVDERVLARRDLNAAVRSGAVIRPATCERCGEIRRVSGHHHDYAKPLDVEWLCYPCHGVEHRGSSSLGG